MKELVDQIKVLGAQFIENATAQAEKGNKAAQARVRKNTLILEKLGKAYRKETCKK